MSRVGPRVRRRLFVRGASVRNCDGRCCRGGTTVSLDERDRILANEKIVREAMTSPARKDPALWFDRKTTKDPDFTCGRTTSTRVASGACVFYREDSLCALQVAGANRLGSPYALKPAICLLWPLAVQDHTLDVGYAWFTRRRECCAPTLKGERTILEVVVPDEQLIRQMSRPGRSRGGGFRLP